MNQLITYGAGNRFIQEATLYPELYLARVISQYGDLYRLVTESGEGLAQVSGKFRHGAGGLAEYPAVGDFVMVDRLEMSGGNAVIHRVLTRKSAFTRAAVGVHGETQVVAANIDIVFICMALNYDYNPSRLERYLSAAWDSRATPVVILTKSDLCDRLPDVLGEVSSIAPGTDILATSHLDGASRDTLLPYLGPGVTASFIGSSGVGKSTLINLLAGGDILHTAATRADDKGRHTSTRRELLPLPGGGVVIDTPGMRELGVESVDLSKSFVDIDQLAAECRFADCAHGGEPGCAVRAAIRSGQLEERRLESYLKLRREAKYDGLNARQIETEKLNAMFGGTGQLKKFRDDIKKKNRGG